MMEWQSEKNSPKREILTTERRALALIQIPTPCSRRAINTSHMVKSIKIKRLELHEKVKQRRKIMILQVKNRKWELTFSISKTLSSSINQRSGCLTLENKSIYPCNLQSVSLRANPSSNESDMPLMSEAKLRKIHSWPR